MFGFPVPQVCDGGPKFDGIGSKCVPSRIVAPGSPPPTPPPSPPAPPPAPSPPPSPPSPPPPLVQKNGAPDAQTSGSPEGFLRSPAAAALVFALVANVLLVV